MTLVVVTCMDGRLDPLSGFGLSLGDAHVVRNAGAEVTDDVVRSVRLARESLGSVEAWLVGHSDCRAHDGDDRRTTATLRAGAAALRHALGDGFRVRPFFYDVRTGALDPLPEETT